MPNLPANTLLIDQAARPLGQYRCPDLNAALLTAQTFDLCTAFNYNGVWFEWDNDEGGWNVAQ